MPRVSKAVADQHHRLITDSASRLFRERGFNHVSVAEVMATAGLTHGGFYGHFDSKEALAAEACEATFERSAERWAQRMASTRRPGNAKAAIIEGYLSLTARDDPGGACATTALAGDVAREPPASPVRKVFGSGIERLVQMLASLENTGSAQADRREALADFATMVGALILARATRDEPLSEEILASARQRLTRD